MLIFEPTCHSPSGWKPAHPKKVEGGLCGSFGNVGLENGILVLLNSLVKKALRGDCWDLQGLCCQYNCFCCKKQKFAPCLPGQRSPSGDGNRCHQQPAQQPSATLVWCLELFSLWHQSEGRTKWLLYFLRQGSQKSPQVMFTPLLSNQWAVFIGMFFFYCLMMNLAWCWSGSPSQSWGVRRDGDVRLTCTGHSLALAMPVCRLP